MADESNPPKRRRLKRWRSYTPPRQYAAFALRDNEPDMAVLAYRNRIYLVTVFVQDFTGRDVPVEFEAQITFDSGDDEDEFWENYHEALREYIKANFDESPRASFWLVSIHLAR